MCQPRLQGNCQSGTRSVTTKASMIIGTLGVIAGGLAGAVALGKKKGVDDRCTVAVSNDGARLSLGGSL